MIIDISEFNSVVNWSKVKREVDLVIIRMGYRGSLSGEIKYDSKYKSHRQACEAYGIPHGFYFFPTAITHDEAVEEADWVANELKDIRAFACPVFADSEQVQADASGRSDKLSREARTALLNTFCSRLQHLGIPAGIYGSTSWLENKLDMSRLPFSVWVAQYAPVCTYKGNYIYWQYSSRGTVAGINGPVDVSVPKMISDDWYDKTFDPQTVINVALGEIGYIEKRTGDVQYLYDKTANPGSNNFTKYGYEMHNLQPKNMDAGAAWCDAFVDWCFMYAYGAQNAKILLGGDFDDYTVQSAQLYKKAGAWVTSDPRPGDQIFFKNASGGICHTGIVYNVDSEYVYTVEGNTSSEVGVVPNGGCVRAKRYPLNHNRIAGYGRPRYAQKPSQKVDTTNYPVIKMGSIRRDYVLLLQNALTVRGYPVDIDGIFGPGTLNAVKKFQKDHYLSVDGVVGAMTWYALFNA